MRTANVIWIAIIGVTLVLRFYNLMWGDGHFFHPDENNMARAVTQIEPGNNYHPGFFAYGQAPLYIAYVSGVMSNFMGSVIHSLNPQMPDTADPISTVSFETAIFWLRFWSAVSSIALIIITYHLSLTIMARSFALISMLLIAFTPGLIQLSRFGTTESILTTLFCTLVYLAIRYVRLFSENKQPQTVQRSSNRIILLLGLAFGLSVGIKLSSAYFIIPILASLLITTISHPFRRVSRTLIAAVILLFSMPAGYVLSSPYNIVDYKGFLGSMSYELAVSNGLNVFYTRQFMDTIPYLFHATHVFPYVLGWPLFILSIISVIYITTTVFHSMMKGNYVKNRAYKPLTIILISAVGYIAMYGHYYIKWTRIMTPVLPLLIMCVCYVLYKIYIYCKDHPSISPHLVQTAMFITVCLSILPGVLFFQIYTQPDVRVSVSRWIYREIPDGSYILSETANVVDIPVEINHGNIRENTATHNYTVVSFNFYELEDVPGKQQELLDELTQAEYIFIPSRRIFMNHLRFPEVYPTATNYYTALFNGTLGFELIHTHHPLPHYRNDEHAEESWTVFDHPIVRIYQKTTPKTRQEYDKILNERSEESQYLQSE